MKRISWISVSLATIGSLLSACGDDNTTVAAGKLALNVKTVNLQTRRDTPLVDHVEDFVKARQKADSRLSTSVVLCQN